MPQKARLPPGSRPLPAVFPACVPRPSARPLRLAQASSRFFSAALSRAPRVRMHPAHSPPVLSLPESLRRFSGPFPRRLFPGRPPSSLFPAPFSSSRPALLPLPSPVRRAPAPSFRPSPASAIPPSASPASTHRRHRTFSASARKSPPVFSFCRKFVRFFCSQ